MKLIILGGLKHSGKTSMGCTIAEKITVPFYDLDRLLLELADGEWASVREIWQRCGREEFIRLEAEVARHFAQTIFPSLVDRRAVLALGGGTIENTKAMKCLKEKGKLIYLRADAQLLFQRIITKSGIPPFLSKEHPWEDFLEIYQKRNSLYEEIADLVHDVDDSTKSVNAQRLLVKLGEHYAG